MAPHLGGIDAHLRLEGTGIDFHGLPNRLPPSEVHGRAVDQLEQLLELQSSCQHLLSVHDSLERLEDRISDLLRLCRIRRKALQEEYPAVDGESDDDGGGECDDSDDGFEDEDPFGEKSDLPPGCGNIK